MGKSKRNVECRAAISCDDFDDWNLVLTGVVDLGGEASDFCR